MSPNRTTCPVCDRAAARVIRELRGQRSGQAWPASFCLGCHSLTVESGYREDEAALRSDLEWNIGKIDHNREYSRGLLRDLLELRPGTKGVLEIGCGVGTFLATARDEFSLAVEGFDINAEAVAWGNERYGLEMQAAEWSAATPGEADLLVSLSCLEHVAKPRPLLSEMASYAKRRGAAIYVSVPFLSPKQWRYARRRSPRLRLPLRPALEIPDRGGPTVLAGRGGCAGCAVAHADPMPSLQRSFDSRVRRAMGASQSVRPRRRIAIVRREQIRQMPLAACKRCPEIR